MFAIINGLIHIGTGEVIDNGTVLIKNGKIEKCGTDIQIPDVYAVIDAAGKTVTPGLIDVHTHLGVHEAGLGREGQDFNETSSAITPQVRALDGINPLETGFEDARAAGITTVQIMPGSANVLGGEMVTRKTVGPAADDNVLRNPSGMKAAMGENPKRLHGEKGKMPTTRMGVAAMLRENLIKAQNYKNRSGKTENERNLGLENLVKVLDKEIPLRVHAHRADDILTVLRIREEFGIDVTIEHCTEGHKIADRIAASGVRVSVGPTMSTRSKVELADKGWHTLRSLADAGVPFSLTTDHPVIGIEYLPASAILAVKHGLTEQQALQAITLNAARHLGVEDRVGSIESGKDADVVIWDGDPFDLRTTVTATYINGELV
ncbi:amidohydrolase [Planococcus lenghuensis]|uniref:Amidohydrolase n=1 Tax=Planococcus lenghuensis TaxID=2213202 RepID=A0A1Q2L2D2_9BACL|nr:amidohydrolase [Planococcus lenghuensis]AQQ54599.1 amidohydrolase [Planococcus lenghuensis]